METIDKNLEVIEDEKPTKEPKNIRKEILSWISLLALAVLLAFFINNVIIVNASVPTGSMRATISEGTRLVAFRLSYLFSEPERFDVVVFSSPDQTGISYVKRIVGLPGDRLEIVGGRVFVNGSDEPLYEWYLYEPPGGLSLTPQNFTIPENSFFVMGDNRNDSRDSRGLGRDPWNNLFVPRENIMGRAAFSYFPRIGSIR
ncbi:MAG: signal peptidase I [Clostridiales bacterium]|nr:signal peptidase I [Clostridiales bacterium]